MADMLNMTADMNMVFLRPRKSDSMPATETPRMEPMRAHPTYQPLESSERENWLATMRVVPETTAVS